MSPLRRGLIAFAMVLVAFPAAAQDPALSPEAARSLYPILIRSAKIGLPAGRFIAVKDDRGAAANVVKNNTWAPVYLELEIAKDIRKDAAIVIESTDSDKLTTRVSFPLQNLSGERPGTRLKAEELRCVPYVRTGGHGEVTVSIRVPEDNNDPQSWSLLAQPFALKYVLTRDVSKYVVLSLGQLPGFTLPRESDNEESGGVISTGNALRNGRIEHAAITTVGQLPDHWFGYEAADLVVLTTSANDTFLNQLFNDKAYKSRLDALLEYVRRGGKLIVTVGRNANLAAQFPLLQEFLPMALKVADPVRQETRLTMSWALARTNRPLAALTAKGGAGIAVANLVAKPDRSARPLVPATGDKPAVVQSAFGLGRVTMVAFDLDRSPFLEYQDRAEFWDLLLREAGSAKASNGGGGGNSSGKFNNFGNYGSYSDSEDDVASGLRNTIDTFDGVPVISFGWVALFIVLYTLLIGPIEYFFLKKVLKRLELTWITFPIIVLTVSAAAYFTAYWIKGDDLKLNKVDVIDIDPASNRVYGRTWLTVFSPRIDRYTVGVQAAPGWIDSSTVPPQAGALVDWYGGTNSGRESLISRSYSYKLGSADGRELFNDGLVDVPIPIWSTKAFSADWSASLDKAAPLVVSNLSHTNVDAKSLAINDVKGTFTLNLPLPEIREYYLVYKGKAWKRTDPILPGVPVNVFLTGEADARWLNDLGSNVAVTPTDLRPVATSYRGGAADLLFHEETLAANDTAAPQNSTLRRLDQSWRLHPRHRDELILVARIPTVKGSSEEILTAKNSASPTVVWLKQLPGSGTRQAVPGTLQQDTVVRIFIPIPPVTP